MKRITINYDKYTTEYQKYIINRFSESIPEIVDSPCDEETRRNHHTYGDFLCVLEAPKPYGVEKEMLVFGKNNPEATLKDFVKYFLSITTDDFSPNLKAKRSKEKT